MFYSKQNWEEKDRMVYVTYNRKKQTLNGSYSVGVVFIELEIFFKHQQFPCTNPGVKKFVDGQLKNYYNSV